MGLPDPLASDGATRLDGSARTGEAPDAAMHDATVAETEAADAAMSDATALCPASIAFGASTTLPLHGAAMPLWTDDCPNGEAIIGYVGSTGGRWLETLQTSCGRLSIVQVGSACRVSVSPGTMMPLRGNPNGSGPWVLSCPTDQVMLV